MDHNVQEAFIPHEHDVTDLKLWELWPQGWEDPGGYGRAAADEASTHATDSAWVAVLPLGATHRTGQPSEMHDATPNTLTQDGMTLPPGAPQSDGGENLVYEQEGWEELAFPQAGETW